MKNHGLLYLLALFFLSVGIVNVAVYPQVQDSLHLFVGIPALAAGILLTYTAQKLKEMEALGEDL